MSHSAFPVEICMVIIEEIFSSQESFRSVTYHLDCPLHQAQRTQRLAWFRNLASVCKAWVGPARSAFWTEVTLFTVQELVVFAHAIEEGTFAKPTCIRRLYFRFISIDKRNPPLPNLETVTEEAQRSFFLTLRQLPAQLDVLYVHSDDTYDFIGPDDVLFRSLQATCRDHSFTLDITELDIQSPRGIRDVFTYFAFARNIGHLILTVSCDVAAFKTPFPSMRLKSLVLQMYFDGGTFLRAMASAARDVTSALRPACTTLHSLTLELYGYDDSSEDTRIEAIKHVLSLNGPSTSVLNLCCKPIYGQMTILQELVDDNAFPPFPMLLCLHLDGFGVSPDLFRQLGCVELRKLEVTVAETENPSARDGVETMKDILDSIELNELANLEDLAIDFSSVEPYDEGRPLQRREGRWVDTEPAWTPLEKACAARNVICIIRHPELVLPVGDSPIP
jgi:hypothetical protein